MGLDILLRIKEKNMFLKRNKMKEKYRQIVFIVTYAEINKETKYLILKRKMHWRGWEFPKGGINFPESRKSAVKREIYEETGKKTLKIKKFNFHGLYKYKKKLIDRKDFVGQAYSLYAVEVKYGKIKLDQSEHSEYKWLSFNDAVNKVTFQNQKRSLGIINKWLKEKSHEGS